MTDCIIIDDNNIEYSSKTTNQLTKKDIKDIEYFFGNDSVILPKNLKEYKDRSNYFNESLERTNVQSLCGIRIKKGNAKFGYIFFHENVISRIWQDKDISFALYLAKIISDLK